jgi:hypothetical protein
VLCPFFSLFLLRALRQVTRMVGTWQPQLCLGGTVLCSFRITASRRAAICGLQAPILCSLMRFENEEQCTVLMSPANPWAGTLPWLGITSAAAESRVPKANGTEKLSVLRVPNNNRCVNLDPTQPTEQVQARSAMSLKTSTSTTTERKRSDLKSRQELVHSTLKYLL